MEQQAVPMLPMGIMWSRSPCAAVEEPTLQQWIRYSPRRSRTRARASACVEETVVGLLGQGSCHLQGVCAGAVCL